MLVEKTLLRQLRAWILFTCIPSLLLMSLIRFISESVTLSADWAFSDQSFFEILNMYGLFLYSFLTLGGISHSTIIKTEVQP